MSGSRVRRRPFAVGVALAAAVLLGVAPGTAAAAPSPVEPTHPSAHALPTVGGGAGARHNPLLQQVLAAGDDDAGAEAPVSAQCQKYIGKPNPYRAIAPDVDMIVGDNYAASGSQGGCFTAQNETAIASNPQNPSNIVAGANDYRVYNSRESRNDSASYAYTSTDGGQTWKDVLLPGLTYSTGAVGALRAMDGAGDPVVSFGPDNTVYFGSIVFGRGAPAAGGTEAPSAIVVNVSHDGGLTFGPPTVVQLDGADTQGTTTRTRVFNDKIWLAADPNSGRVYVTWTRFLDDADGGYVESPIVVASSNDGGATYSKYRRIDTALGASNPGLEPFSQGSNPQVAPDGTLYVAYETSFCRTAACDQPTDRDVTVVAKSTDLGRTFVRSVVGTNFDFPYDPDLGSLLTGENFRINSFPQITIDPATSQLLLTWVDDRNGTYDANGASVRTNGDNVVSSSTDGITWTRPTAVGSGQDEIFGAIASYGGTAAVVSYTRNYQPDKVLLDFAYWPVSATPGQAVTSGAIVRLTTQSSDPRVQFAGLDDDGNVVQGTFIGDYAAVSIGADKRIHPAWTDFRGNPGTTTPNQDAVTRTVALS